MQENEIRFISGQPLELIHDEIPLLSVQMTLPYLEGRNGRFNRYYRLCAKRFEQYCRRELFPLAQAAYCRALEDSSPIPQWQATITSYATWQRENIVSLVCDTAVTGMTQPIQRRQGDTWDLRRELFLSLPDCFPAGVPWKRQLMEYAAQTIAQQEAAGVARYCDNWSIRLRSAFHPQQFYLGEDGLYFFFPYRTIAPAVEGIPTFCLPYNGNTGPFIPPL